MAWNKNLPADNSKVRLVPGYLRANWSALEDGDVPYDKIYLNKQAVDPTGVPNAGYIFPKDPGTGITEIYYKDSQAAANAIQLTSSARLGAATTPMICESIQAVNGYKIGASYTNTQNAFCSAWAVVDLNGNLLSGYGLTSSRNLVGDYTLNFSAALTGANYVVIGTVFTSLTRARVLYCYNRLAASFSVRTQAVNANAGTYEDADFMVTVFGGR